MLTTSKHSRAGAVSLAAAGVIGLSGCGSGSGASSTPGSEAQEGTATHVMNADFPHYEKAADMYASSSTVVIGKIVEERVEVIDISSPMITDDEKVNAQAGEQIGEPVPADMVFTVYTLDIEDVLKRELKDAVAAAGSTIEIKVPGGKIGDAEFILQGAPKLTVDPEEEFVFFLEEYGDDMPASPLNNDQAVLGFDNATGEIHALEGATVPPTFLRDVRRLATD